MLLSFNEVTFIISLYDGVYLKDVPRSSFFYYPIVIRGDIVNVSFFYCERISYKVG